MIDSLKFEAFRGFTDLSITPLKRVNLIAGANNTGKTGILEALWLLFGDGNQISPLPSVFRSNVSGQPNQHNSDDFATFWEALFHDKDISAIPKITASYSKITKECQLQKTELEVQVRYRRTPDSKVLVDQYLNLHPRNRNRPDTGPDITIDQSGVRGGGKNPFATKFIVLTTRLEHPTRDAELFNQVSLLEGGEERLTSLLREIDPRLQKLRYLKAPGTHQSLVYAYFGLKNAISMTQTGQGFSKLFSLFCQMLVSKAELLFVDEIENGLYYETLPIIWKGISTLAKSENIQVFATTHSRECILAAHDTFSTASDYDFALHRLQRVNGRIEAVTHDREMLDVAIRSGMEVR